MTQEQKAKAYDEALEKAKEYMVKGYDVLMPDLFPELKESEDERIRKALLTKFTNEKEKGAKYDVHGVSLDDIIAYLEKQKEQKPSLNFEVISSWLRDHIRRYINSEYNEFHHCFEYDGTINVEELIDDLKVVIDNNAFDVDAAFDARESRDNWEYIKEFCDKFGRMPKDMDELDVLVSYVMNKRQKEQPTNEEMLRTLRAEYEKGVADTIAKYEQKPSDYEKPLLSKFEQAVYDCAWNKVTCKPEGETQEEYAKRWAEQLLLMVRDWADDYIDSQIISIKRKAYDKGKVDAEKPAEWSYPYGRNETVDRLVSLAECIEMDGDCLFNGYSGTECGKFLRELARKQVECKPAEWSEEEKEFIKHCAELLDKQGEPMCALRLESLQPQPHWKPSEEQMDVLKDAKMRLALGGYGLCPELQSLINDLNKL